MKALLTEYNAKEEKSFEDILDFHVKFERIHPFQDGSGRVGRLIMFKECLKLIDIQEKLRSGKGAGYECWAKVFNLKQMVNTMEFLKEHQMESLEELTDRTKEITENYHACQAAMLYYIKYK